VNYNLKKTVSWVLDKSNYIAINNITFLYYITNYLQYIDITILYTPSEQCRGQL